MMKTILAAAAGLLAVLLPAAGQSAPQPPAPPARILVTLQAVEVHGGAAQQLVLGPFPAPGMYDALLKSEGSEATEISVQTPNDSPGVARYSQFVTFTTHDQGKAVRNVMTAPTSLEATPHINTDGTITVDLKWEVTRVAPAAGDTIPMTTTQSMTTRRTFKSSQTLLFGGTALTAPGSKPGEAPAMTESLQFVTVTLLPGKVAAR